MNNGITVNSHIIKYDSKMNDVEQQKSTQVDVNFSHQPN